MVGRAFSSSSPTKSAGILVWLWSLIVLIGVMILVGGATRLTNAGLSITEWRPVTGAMPPMGADQWDSEFSKYKQIPEFLAEHPDMDLAGFKFIYFMEWSHRQLGRFIGLVALIPLLVFWLRGRLPHGKTLRFFMIFFLILIQGALGWWMVSSGLTERVDVSQYRLAAHLGLAFIILGFVFSTLLNYRQNWPLTSMRPLLQKRSLLLLLLVFLQIIAGAFVAGTHAGQAYNTWPLMDGGIIPRGYLAASPWWINWFENTAAIQFNHRMIAYAVGVLSLLVCLAARKTHDPSRLRASFIVLICILFQIILGVLALLKFVELPYALAHQGGAIFVFMACVYLAHNAAKGRY